MPGRPIGGQCDQSLSLHEWVISVPSIVAVGIICTGRCAS